MLFDLDLIKKVYSELPAKVISAKKMLGRPLTLAEKILYSPDRLHGACFLDEYEALYPGREEKPVEEPLGVWCLGFRV